jgi:hypothetical protein
MRNSHWLRNLTLYVWIVCTDFTYRCNCTYRPAYFRTDVLELLKVAAAINQSISHCHHGRQSRRRSRKFVYFSRSRFIHDFITLSKSMNAPYSQTTIENILIAFNEHWENSAILFRCTDRPGGVVNFRFFARRRVDMIAIAAHATVV